MLTPKPSYTIIISSNTDTFLLLFISMHWLIIGVLKWNDLTIPVLMNTFRSCRAVGVNARTSNTKLSHTSSHFSSGISCHEYSPSRVYNWINSCTATKWVKISMDVIITSQNDLIETTSLIDATSPPMSAKLLQSYGHDKDSSLLLQILLLQKVIISVCVSKIFENSSSVSMP